MIVVVFLICVHRSNLWIKMNNKQKSDPQTYSIIGSAMAVHAELGCGFLEVVYQVALEKEFQFRKIPYEREKPINVYYRGEIIGRYIADFICYNEVILELKALSVITGTEESQLINYLKASKLNRGLLLNFGTKHLQYKRFVF